MTKNESLNEELVQILAYELNYLRKLAAERLDQVKELERDLEAVRKLCNVMQGDYNDLCRVTSTEAAKLSTELTEARETCTDHARIQRELKADCDLAQTNANHWAKRFTETLTERDEARAELRGLHKVCADQHAELTNWRGINRVWEGEEALAKLKVECQALRAERDAVVAYRLVQVEQDSRVLSSVEAELATARSNLASERQERIEWQGCAKGLEAELATAPAELRSKLAFVLAQRDEARDMAATHLTCYQELYTELATARASHENTIGEFHEARLENKRLKAELATERTGPSGYGAMFWENEAMVFKAELATVRAALSKLEQAAREAHRVMSDHESMDLDAAMDAAVVMIERALPAAAEQTSGPLITNSEDNPDPNEKCWMIEASDAGQVAPAPVAAADLKARVRAAAEEASKHWQPPATPTHDAAERELHYKAAILDELPGDPDNLFDTVAQLKRRKEQKRADAARVATERERARCLAAQPPAEVYGWGQETILLWRERIASGEPTK